jgi:protein TonB
MRAMSSAASITIHAVLGAAFLLGTKETARSEPESGIDTTVVWVAPPTPPGAARTGLGLPLSGPDPWPDLSSIPHLSQSLQSAAMVRDTFSTGWTPRAEAATGAYGVWASEAPAALSGPLPAYPELLRQAGIEGQVVLEARVDTAGRVQRASILVVSASHAGFVAPARQALISTLFRPARANGRAVSTLIRVPFTFSIRGGTGRAR